MRINIRDDGDINVKPSVVSNSLTFIYKHSISFFHCKILFATSPAPHVSVHARVSVFFGFSFNFIKSSSEFQFSVRWIDSHQIDWFLDVGLTSSVPLSFQCIARRSPRINAIWFIDVIFGQQTKRDRSEIHERIFGIKSYNEILWIFASEGDWTENGWEKRQLVWTVCMCACVFVSDLRWVNFWYIYTVQRWIENRLILPPQTAFLSSRKSKVTNRKVQRRLQRINIEDYNAKRPASRTTTTKFGKTK